MQTVENQFPHKSKQWWEQEFKNNEILQKYDENFGKMKQQRNHQRQIDNFSYPPKLVKMIEEFGNRNVYFLFDPYTDILCGGYLDISLHNDDIIARYDFFKDTIDVKVKRYPSKISSGKEFREQRKQWQKQMTDKLMNKLKKF